MKYEIIKKDKTLKKILNKSEKLTSSEINYLISRGKQIINLININLCHTENNIIEKNLTYK